MHIWPLQGNNSGYLPPTMQSQCWKQLRKQDEIITFTLCQHHLIPLCLLVSSVVIKRQQRNILRQTNSGKFPSYLMLPANLSTCSKLSSTPFLRNRYRVDLHYATDVYSTTPLCFLRLWRSLEPVLPDLGPHLSIQEKSIFKDTRSNWVLCTVGQCTLWLEHEPEEHQFL